MYWCVFLLFIVGSSVLFFREWTFPDMGLGVVLAIWSSLVWSGLGSWSALCWLEGHLVDVLREPAEALAVTLSLQHAAHEHLQRSRVKLLQRDIALACCLTI